MRSARHSLASECGLALSELLVSSAVMSVVAAAVLTGSITLQKSFRASQHYAQSQASQLRLIDYVSLDLRRALSVKIPQPDQIQLTIPNYYAVVNGKHVARDPEIKRNENTGRLGIQYGGAPVTVAYYVERPADSAIGTLIREEGGVKKAIANEVREFLPNFERSTDAADDSEQIFKVSVTFAPKYQWSGDGNSVRGHTKIASRVLLRNKRTR